MAAFAMTAAMAIAATPASEGIKGTWLHPERSVIIRLAPCEDALCGTVTWATEPAKKAARKGIDQLIGARLLTDFRPRGKGAWKGKIFIPDLDLHVTGKIQPLDPNRLKVSGCILGGVICRSQVWTRTDQAVAKAD